MKNRWMYLIAITIIVAILSVVAVIFINRDSGDYVATIADEKVTVAEYKFFLNVVKRNLETGAEKNDADFSKVEFWKSSIDGKTTQEYARELAIEEVKEFKTLLIKAKEKNLVLDKASLDSVDKYFDREKSRFGDDAEAKFLAQYGVSEADVRSIYKDGKLKDKFEAEEKKAITASDSEVRSYFDKNKSALEEVSVRQILLMTTDESGTTVNSLSKADQQKAKRVAEDILNKIKSGENMAELAKKYSQDTSSKENGGLLDPFKRGRVSAVIEKWAFKAKVGDVSMLKDDYGYHVIRLEVKKDQYKELENEAKAACINQKYNDIKDAWFKDEKYNMVENKEVLDTISVTP